MMWRCQTTSTTLSCINCYSRTGPALLLLTPGSSKKNPVLIIVRHDPVLSKMFQARPITLKLLIKGPAMRGSLIMLP